jgi:hypothetical protein
MKLSISVYPPEGGAGFGGGVRIFEREVNWPFLPQPDRDLINILKSKEDADQGVEEWYANVKIRHVWFTPEGIDQIELVPFQVDPIPQMRSLCDGYYRQAWNTSIDGDVIEQLLYSGWTEWRP